MRDVAYSRFGASRWRQATALALLALLLMPVNYRAGAGTPHGHALIQLIHEARARAHIRHHAVDQARSAHPGGDVAASQTGSPAVTIVASAALLPLLLALAILSVRDPVHPRTATAPDGHAVAPAHPPPRLSAAVIT